MLNLKKINDKFMKLNLKPTAGYLLIEPQDKEVKTLSGIYLPDNAGKNLS